MNLSFFSATHDGTTSSSIAICADEKNMKVHIKSWMATAHWRWKVGDGDTNDDDDVCGICRIAFDGCCPECKVPGDDCPLSKKHKPSFLSKFIAFLLPPDSTDLLFSLVRGECTHCFHMHCLLKWITTDASKQQCPMDRRPWVTAS